MLDSMMERLKAEESVNINEFLKEMRSKRMYLVQTLVSMVLLHLYVCVYSLPCTCALVTYLFQYNYDANT